MHRHSLEDAVTHHHAALPAAWLHCVYQRLLALSAHAGTFSARSLFCCAQGLHHFPFALSSSFQHDVSTILTSRDHISIVSC